MAITGINNSSCTSYYASNYKNTVKKTDSEKDSTNTKDGNVTTSTVNGCLGTLTNLSYKVDENGNISVAISGTNDPDGKIAKENVERKAKENRETEEKVKEKRAAKKAEEEKAEKKRAEKSAEGKETGDYTLSVTGNDVKSMTQSLVAESVSISAPDRSSFDIKA